MSFFDVIIDPQLLWIVISSFVVSFILAFVLGANDVANSFGTSVGAKVLTLRQACILGTIFETVGAILLGARVSDTIRKGVISVSSYEGEKEVLLVGMLAALVGAAIWLMVATMLKLPVSGTHSTVAAVLGFAFVARGTEGVDGVRVGLIFSMWIIAPLLSGAVTVGIFMIIKYLVLRKDDKLSGSLMLLPIFYGVTIIVNMFSIFYKGPEQLYLDRIPLWGTFIIAIGSGAITAICVRVFLVPYQRRTILAETERLHEAEMNEMKEQGDDNSDNKMSDNKISETKMDNASTNDLVENEEQVSGSTEQSTSSIDDPEHQEVNDDPATAKLFSKLQILTAIFGSFAHGGNDVSNAIGPLVAIWLISTEGNVAQKSPTPIPILAYGGLGITVGLWVLGRRVIKTVGEDLTKITPSSGFAIEIGSALTVLVCSNIGMPVSTTHCKIGSVVFVGRVRSKENVDWKIFRNIIIAWFVTLPASGLISAGVFYGLQYLVPPLGPPWNMPVLNATSNYTISPNFTTNFPLTTSGLGTF